MTNKTTTFLLLLIMLQVIGCSNDRTQTIKIDTTDNDSITFIQKMESCENIYLPVGSSEVYVTDLHGSLYLLDGKNHSSLEIIKEVNYGKYMLGVVGNNDDKIFAVEGKQKWLSEGGRIRVFDNGLNSLGVIAEGYPGINGMTMDNDHNIYFATGNMNPFKTDGAIYRMLLSDEGTYGHPEVYINTEGSANGIFYNEIDKSIVFTETFSGVNKIDMTGKNVELVFGKSRLVEAFDDLCVDSNGNYWVADTPTGFIKMYNPRTKNVTRFIFKDVGIASSCKTRVENGKEILYITEISKRRGNLKHNGRGIIIVPVDYLLNKI